MLISVFFNHTGTHARTPPGSSGSKADFFGERLSVNHDAARTGDNSGSDLMTSAGRLSVITACLAMAFVGAIVLGMI